jgi:hypothetical protein
LREFKVRHGITFGLVFLNPASLEEGQNRAKNYRQQMVAAKALPENSAIFVIRDEKSYLWQFDERVKNSISNEQVRYAWTLTSDTSNRAELARQFLSQLSQLLGGKGPIGAATAPVESTPPTVTPPVNTSPVTPVSTPVAPVGVRTSPALLPGAVIGEKRIGPAGGTLAIPNQVTVEFPPGALKSEERITVRGAQGKTQGAQFVFIEREGGSTLLAHPAKVRFTLPANMKGSDALPAQEVVDGMYTISPSSYDAKTRTLEIEALHFSGTGWFNKENCISAVGGFVTAVGACIVVVAVSGPAILTAQVGAGVLAAKAIVVTATAVGAAAANRAYDSYQRIGLDGVLTLGSQENSIDWILRWKSSDYTSDSLVVSVATDSGGTMVYPVPGRFTKEQIIAGLSGRDSAGASLAQRIEGVQIVPRKIFVAAWALLQTRAYYSQNKYNPPGAVEVLVDANLSKSKANEVHPGEWDEKFLRVHSDLVIGLAPSGGELFEGKRDELLATVAHEYWHVIFFAKGYKNTSKFSWLDESMATTLESEVGPGYKKSFEMYQAPTVALQFERGLNAFTDQYCAWPLCKYILHKKGGAYLTDVALGKYDAIAWGGINGLFADFVRSLLIKEYALPDPIPGTGAAIQTGWSKLEPSDWMAAQAGSSARGYLALGATTGSTLPPMAYWLRRVMIAPSATAKQEAPAPLIIRREKPDTHELFIALKPQFAGGGQAQVGGRRDAADVRQGLSGVAVPKEWQEKPSSLVPVGLVNTTAVAGNSSALFVYLLRPPSGITSTPAAGNVTLRWKLPEFGANLKPADAVRGYRVFYKTKDGKDVMVPDLLIKPDTDAVTMLASAMPGFVAVGVATEDGGLRDANGEFLRSAIGWPEAAGGVVKVRVTEPKPDDLSTYGPMEVLGGKPIPNVVVNCDYTDKGKPVHREATTNKNGECQFGDVPLNVEIKISARGLSRMVMATDVKPQAFAPFGWQGHEVSKDEPIDNSSLPRSDF